MENNVVIDIPHSFLHPLFFADTQTMHIENLNLVVQLEEKPFLFDMLHSLQMSEIKPWEDKNDAMHLIFKIWKKKKQDIESYFKERNRKKAKAPMTQQAANFMTAIFWANGLPVSNVEKWEEEISQLKLKPVNLEERFAFIISSPDHYHAFIQISELFAELEKQFIKLSIIEKTRG